MNSEKFLRFLLATALIAFILTMGAHPAAAGALGASYFSLSASDPDVGNDCGMGTVSTVVGGGLGPDGLPVLSSFGLSCLHDFNASNELEWWSPALDSNVTVLNNPVYPSTITLPFDDDNMYTNTTILGVDGDDSSAFLTAEYTGTFTVPSSADISFSVCSDDDSFVYLSGGAFGSGTDVVDNGGIHGVSCSSGNENAGMLTGVAAGTYTLTIFYDDREGSGAGLEVSSNMTINPTSTPEPGTLVLLGIGLGALGLLRRQRAFAGRTQSRAATSPERGGEAESGR